MGHLTITASTLDGALAKAEQARAELRIRSYATSDNRVSTAGYLPAGSDSDLSVMRDAATALGMNLNLPWMTIVSAHRTPDRMIEHARSAAGRGLQVIIAKGGAAHLPGMSPC